jgi:hypothetical protein
MRAIQRTRIGSKGKTRNEVTIVDPTPAAFSLATPTAGFGGGIRLSSISFVTMAKGIMRGRFSGLKKNAKTRSTGEGTHCSNRRWVTCNYCELISIGGLGMSWAIEIQPSSTFFLRSAAATSFRLRRTWLLLWLSSLPLPPFRRAGVELVPRPARSAGARGPSSSGWWLGPVCFCESS